MKDDRRRESAPYALRRQGLLDCPKCATGSLAMGLGHPADGSLPYVSADCLDCGWRRRWQDCPSCAGIAERDEDGPVRCLECAETGIAPPENAALAARVRALDGAA